MKYIIEKGLGTPEIVSDDSLEKHGIRIRGACTEFRGYGIRIYPHSSDDHTEFSKCAVLDHLAFAVWTSSADLVTEIRVDPATYADLCSGRGCPIPEGQRSCLSV